MQGFTGKLVLEEIDGRRWRLWMPWGYTTAAGEKILVRGGFITDFASVPRLFWRVLPPSGEYNEAALIHDWCYRMRWFPRARCDEIFLEIMEFQGIGYCTRYTMYWAVRMFGWSVYGDPEDPTDRAKYYRRGGRTERESKQQTGLS